ncbi:MAG TPA: hypothetical protein ENK28_12030 [Aliiroseovarius sp.]|nr:hypothetical protein [Aliiroseovarius sp.]
MRLLSLLLLSMLGLATSAFAGEVRNIDMYFEGRDRDFLLYIPDNISQFSAPYPLVVVLHGIASTSEQVMEKSHGRFNELAGQFGFVVAYPNGLARNWDLGDGNAAALVLPKRDDRAFVAAVIDDIGARLPIDTSRVFATGFSLGGQMAFSMACTRPGLIRAVATVSMPLPAFLDDDCQTADPFGVLLIHGTADPWVPYEGGTFPVGPKPRDIFLSHNASLAFFRAKNRCNPEAEDRATLDNVDDGTGIVIRAWRDCQGPAVASIAIFGGGHTWPKEDQALASRPVVGRVSQEIDAANEIWTFFQSF